jgi:hypothetical protein
MNAATALAAFRIVRGNSVPRVVTRDPRSFAASDIEFEFSRLISLAWPDDMHHEPCDLPGKLISSL